MSFNFIKKILSFLDKQQKFQSRQHILDFLQYADGTNNIKKISKYISLSLSETRLIQKTCKKYNLLS